MKSEKKRKEGFGEGWGAEKSKGKDNNKCGVWKQGAGGSQGGKEGGTLAGQPTCCRTRAVERPGD